MNYCVQDWNMEDELLTVGNQRKSMEPENELVELLWRNGQVVLQSQTHRRQGPTMNGSKQVQKPDQLALKGGSYGNSSTLINEDETSTWIQYPLEDSLEKEFCSEFLYELPTSDPIETDKQIKPFKGDKDVKLGASEETNALLPKSSLLRSQQLLFKQSNNSNFAENPMPPPGLQIPDLMQQGPNLGGVDRIVNFSHFSRLNKANLGMSNGPMIGPEELNSSINGEVGETSVMTIGSSHCGSNQVPNEADFGRFSSNGVGATGIFTGPIKEDAQKVFPQRERGQTNMLETAVTSSSGGSGGSIGRIGKQSTSTHSQKRKGKDEDDSECQSEEAEFESAKPKKSTQRSGSVRRNRAAEVHNLSERRRRDRINEKMRALQELIPHCNKSDKASMLDEAIEYLKSLQLQLQIMWMGSSMAPMMFPGVQHYMSRMGMGMAPPPLPSIHSSMQLPRVPLVDQAISVAATPNHPAMCQTPVLNPVNFQNQMQNPNYPEQYTHYMGFHPMQAVPQPMNMFGYAPQSLQQSHKITPPSNSGGPCNGGAPTNNTPKSNLATISDVNRLAHGYSCLSDARGPLNEPNSPFGSSKIVMASSSILWYP